MNHIHCPTSQLLRLEHLSLLLIGFVVDMFGADVDQGDSLPIPERIQLTTSILGNGGQAARMRQLAGLKAAIASDALSAVVDPTNVAAIGYCFGGSSVLEFMRMQPDGLKGLSWMERYSSPQPQGFDKSGSQVLSDVVSQVLCPSMEEC